jgi:RNA polymerase sigma factor (TIGR02999 family)
MSAAYLRRQHPHPTIQTTELVQETYIKLAENGPERYINRPHFFGAASRVMRQTLIDHSRRRRAKKRGGDWQRVELDEAAATMSVPAHNSQELHASLERLNTFDSGLRKIIELRFFYGLSMAEVAAQLHSGQSTVRRDLALAKAWLQRELNQSALRANAT